DMTSAPVNAEMGGCRLLACFLLATTYWISGTVDAGAQTAASGGTGVRPGIQSSGGATSGGLAVGGTTPGLSTGAAGGAAATGGGDNGGGEGTGTGLPSLRLSGRRLTIAGSISETYSTNGQGVPTLLGGGAFGGPDFITQMSMDLAAHDHTVRFDGD